jgi:hypothetical protein
MNADSLAVAQLTGALVDNLFGGLDPTLRSLIVGLIVSVIYQFTWKRFVSPQTSMWPNLTALWEANRTRLNSVAPALVALIVSLVQTGKLDWNSLVTVLAAWGGWGIFKGVVGAFAAKPTPAGQRSINAAVGLLMVGMLLTASAASAQTLTSAFTSRFNPTVAVGVVERWEGVTRLGGSLPSPRLAIQPGINWNDSVALRGRVEWGIRREGLPARHPWSVELGVWFVPRFGKS